MLQFFLIIVIDSLLQGRPIDSKQSRETILTLIVDEIRIIDNFMVSKNLNSHQYNETHA